jgi:hypothetical protein
MVQDDAMQGFKSIAINEKNVVLKPLSFLSTRLPFHWDKSIKIGEEVDGLIIQSVIFNKRKSNLFKRMDFGIRAKIGIMNTSSHLRMPGFAIAVFDAENRMLGVASGGNRIGGVRAGESTTFDLNFYQVVERISKAEYFYLSTELAK